MVKLQPFGERVVIRVLELNEKSAGGLLVAPVSKASSNRGIVVATGEGTLLQDGSFKPLSIKVGDEVLFQLGAGISYTNGKEDYKVLSVRDILGKYIEE